MSSRGELGRRGEQVAAEYLRGRGYRIVTTNWRSSVGELDMVATKDGQVVIVEVRSRGTESGATAAESVGPGKQRRLLRTAESYLQLHAPSASARIDVVTVFFSAGRAPDVRHIVGAVSA